jgi:2-phosphosulfolactate phosphatase
VREQATGTVAVIPAGERWRGATGPLRPAFEDWVGAGAVIDALGADTVLAPEARAARAAFRDAQDDLGALLHACPSGREKHARGQAADIDLAAAHDDVSDAVPVLDGAAFRDA